MTNMWAARLDTPKQEISVTSISALNKKKTFFKVLLEDKYSGPLSVIYCDNVLNSEHVC